MGPPELPGGNLPALGEQRSDPVGLQWGRRNYPAETYVERSCTVQEFAASMGPPELPGGNWQRRSLRLLPWQCFNGAAGITRRKLAAPIPTTTAMAMLQWGRRNYPAETYSAVPSDAMVFLASMGPPELPGGNPRGRDLYGSERNPLQWGRRNYPAETRCRQMALRRYRRCFNGAAGITRRKHDAARWLSAATDAASMGPPELPGGNLSTTLPSPSRAGSLQWGRRNYPAETS